MSTNAIVRGRFAPSPSGELHLGNVWTALLAWLHARQQGGAFVVRVEDLDPDRSRPELARQQLADLRWLGFDWDEGPDVGGMYGPYTQSERREQYATALDLLMERGLVYPCYCTRAEVRAAATAPHGAEGRGDYPATCRDLTPAERREREALGRNSCLRVRMPETPSVIRFVDMVYGPIEEDLAREAGDFVIRRADGIHAYQLAVVVDDAAMSITDVVRGADLLGSTARQIWLHQQLGNAAPRFGHVPLLVGADGHRLSKRHASLSVASLRTRGITAPYIIGWLGYLAGLLPEATPALPYELVDTLALGQLPQADVRVEEIAVPGG